MKAKTKMGRPTKPKHEKRIYTYAVRLTHDEHKQLQRATKVNDQTSTDLIRSGIIQYIGLVN